MSRRRTLLRSERGYAMVAVLAVMLVASLAAIAAVRATDFDLVQGANDRDSKRAFAAAEAGVSDYLARLSADVNFWESCANDQGISPRWDGAGADPREPNAIPGSTATYKIEVLPANGAVQCSSTDAAATFIDDQTGVFRIRATGEAGDEKRSVVASFKRRGFLDFVYFTDYETFPAELGRTHQWLQGNPTRVSASDPTSYVQWAENNCARYYRDGRGLATNVYSGQEFTGGSWQPIEDGGGTPRDVPCVEIQFKSDASGTDRQRGPFHTNDELLICGSPWFGEKPSDDVEVSAPPPGGGGSGNPEGWRASCGGSLPKVNFPPSAADGTVGTWRKSSPLMTLPPSNQSVADEALPAYRFVGRTTIVMNGDTMTVTGKRASGQVLTAATLALPDKGVISIAHDPSGACTGLDVLRPLSSSTACGDLWINGTYNKNVTFTAANDILVRDDVLKSSTSDVMLGLIASQFVRVHHPTTTDGYNCGTNNGGPGDIRIDAAILAVNKSFTVDKYWCGANLGTLTVNGAIAQQFRGPVGRGSSGYTKDYVYDRRLRFRSPPKFLDPVESSWRLKSQVEQVPAT